MDTGNHRAGGCGRKGDKVVSLANFQDELDKLAKADSGKTFRWNNYPLAQEVIRKYRGKVTCSVIQKMLNHVHPERKWTRSSIEHYIERNA